MNRTTATEEQIAAAADWWTARLRSCRHSGLSVEERRSGSNRGYELAEMLMTVTRPTVTDEQAKAFNLALRTGLRNRRAGGLGFGVDYDPDPVLGDALTAAGLPDRMGVLPIKTMMWIEESGDVRVRYGYGADIQVVLKGSTA